MLYFLSRLGQAAITLFILTVIVFGAVRLTGDPAASVLPADATAADRDFFRHQYGLDRPLPEQYFLFIRNAVSGDFGVSFRYRVPALDMVGPAIGPTLELTSLAMLLSVLIGLPMGILSAVYQGTLIDRLSNLYASLAQSIPSFWFGLMLIMVFAVMFPIFPSSGYGTAGHFVLPVITLSLFASASIARLTHANMEEALRSDFVHAERILALSERRIVLKHALRNASLPIVTFFGLQFGLLMGGAIVTERVFAWPGLGQLIVGAILSRDYPIVEAGVLVTALFFMAVNLVVDFVCMILDPRVRR
jgi:peptide/nickel transport system permease protein